ncbi:MAG: DNA recombination protein RmuC [Chloroflexi bacterium]|nr:DNA recombination protein RmuC [Chloroflexota bacterium]
MDMLVLGISMALVGLSLFAVAAALYITRRPGSNLETADLAVLGEKLSRIEPIAQLVSGVQVELRGLSERVASVERSQSAVDQRVQSLRTGLAENNTITNALVDSAAAIREALTRANEGLVDLKSQARARQDIEQRTAESIRRLEAVIAGTQTRGAAGENILDALFSRLPADWQVRDFRVGNKSVEFGLRLPNNLILPIDSKWTSAHLIEQLADCEDVETAQRLKAQIESAVLAKAREVRKYIDPRLTVNFGVAAIPDAVYDLCGGIQADVFTMNVVLVSYSMFVPYLLLVFQTVLRTSQDIDLEKLNASIHTAQRGIQALQEEIEGRFSRAITYLNNSREDMRANLSKISSGLTSLQLTAGATDGHAPLSMGVPGEGGFEDSSGYSL